METVLAILYSIVGYWAVNRTIYAHYVMVGDIGSIILRKWMVGLIAGPVCIPWAGAGEQKRLREERRI